jgi:hypothetical protein
MGCRLHPVRMPEQICTAILNGMVVLFALSAKISELGNRVGVVQGLLKVSANSGPIVCDFSAQDDAPSKPPYGLSQKTMLGSAEPEHRLEALRSLSDVGLVQPYLRMIEFPADKATILSGISGWVCRLFPILMAAAETARPSVDRSTTSSKPSSRALAAFAARRPSKSPRRRPAPSRAPVDARPPDTGVTRNAAKQPATA